MRKTIYRNKENFSEAAAEKGSSFFALHVNHWSGGPSLMIVTGEIITMQILVTGEQMKQLDQATIQTMGIPSLVLMAGAELFTGSNFVMAVGMFQKKVTILDAAATACTSSAALLNACFCSS